MATIVSGMATLCPLVSADVIKEIIDTDLTDAQVNHMINLAYYAALPLTGKLGGCGGGDAQCEIIVVLAAHFITMRERQAKSESIAGEWSITYLGKEGLGLEASLYGQQAIAMDCSGTLAKAGLKGVLFKVADYETLEELSDET